jgi:hypothetical protein
MLLYRAAVNEFVIDVNKKLKLKAESLKLRRTPCFLL